MELPFGKSRAEDSRISRLVDLWERAQSAASHPAGCMCRGVLMPSIDPRMLEDDILDYLQTRYEDVGHTRLSAVIEGRRGQLMVSGRVQRFEEWLPSLEGLPPEDRDIILDDLERSLQSFEPLDRGGFACY